jgi:septum formation protein
VAPPRLVLASASPRRRALLAELGVACEIVAAPDDGPPCSRDPAERVVGHARHKARLAAAARPDAWVLAGDTLVVLDGEFLAKPRDRGDAERMLRALGGRTHEVWTGTVLRAPDGREDVRADCARVRFARPPEPELRRYLDGEEWRDKAGAYGIQGWAGEWASLESGSLGTVIGFDAGTVGALLAEAGLRR